MKRKHATQEEWALSPEIQMIQQQEEGRAWGTLACLPEQWRRIAFMRWVEGWDRARVADALNLTEGTVRSIEARARVRMRERMDARPRAA